MIAIYSIIGALSGYIWLKISSHLSNNRRRLIAIAIVIFSMLGTKIYISPYYQAATYEHNLRENDPAMNIIAGRFSVEFHAYIETVKRSYRTHENNGNSDLSLFYELQFLNRIFLKELKYADNKSIYQFYNSKLIFYKQLYEIDPILVLLMEYPDKFKNRAGQYFLISQTKRMIANEIVQKQEAVILSAINNPQPALTENEKNQALAILKTISGKLINTYGQDYILNMNSYLTSPASDKNKIALIIISMIAEILNTGENNTGIIYRYLSFF